MHVAAMIIAATANAVALPPVNWRLAFNISNSDHTEKTVAVETYTFFLNRVSDERHVDQQQRRWQYCDRSAERSPQRSKKCQNVFRVIVHQSPQDTAYLVVIGHDWRPTAAFVHGNAPGRMTLANVTCVMASRPTVAKAK